MLLLLQLLVIEKPSEKLSSYAPLVEDNLFSNQDEPSKLDIKVLLILIDNELWTRGNCKPVLRLSFLFDTTTLFLFSVNKNITNFT